MFGLIPKLEFFRLIRFYELSGETFALSIMQFHYLVSVCVCMDSWLLIPWEFSSSDKLYPNYTSNGNDTIASGNQQFITILPMNTWTEALLPLLLLLKMIRNAFTHKCGDKWMFVRKFDVWMKCQQGELYQYFRYRISLPISWKVFVPLLRWKFSLSHRLQRTSEILINSW